MSQECGQGIEDQYVLTCCMAQHIDKSCVLFGARVDDDGKKWAIIAFPQEVPIEEVATWSRKAKKAAEATPPDSSPVPGHPGG